MNNVDYKSQDLVKISFFIISALLLIWFAGSFFYAEHIPFTKGLGWDGALYGDLAYRFGFYIHGMMLDKYSVQRVFPSLMVHVFAKILGYPLNTPLNIIHAFYLFNVIVTFLGMWGYYCIARRQQWGLPVFLIGFSILFLNYPILKLMSYYAVLTDYTALALGIWALYFYLENKFIGLILIALIGAFTFPTMLYSCILLMLFPFRKLPGSIGRPLINIVLKNPLGARKSALICAAFFMILPMCFLRTVDPSQLMEKYLQMVTLYCPQHLYPLHSIGWGIVGLIGVFLYVFAMILPFIRARFLIKIEGVRLCGVIALIFAVNLLQWYFSNGKPGPLTSFLFLEHITAEAIVNPLVFLVSHFVYYGPGVLLMVLFWKEMVAIVRRNWFGLFVSLLFYGVLSVGSESRQFINAVPMFAFVLCEVLHKKSINLRFSIWLLGIGLLISKFWLVLNIAPWSESVNIFEFPYQMYFMNQGAYMNNEMYFLQLVLMLMVFYGLWSWKKRVQNISHVHDDHDDTKVCYGVKN